MVPNSKHPLKKMGKNDQRVDAQVDRPAVMAMCRSPVNKEQYIFQQFTNTSVCEA